VAEGQLALLVETNHLGDSKHSWPPCTDTILAETCHRMHDRSYRSGGRDEQAADLFTQKLDGVAWRSKPSSYIVATKDPHSATRTATFRRETHERHNA
jgi:hypothetical protein